MYRKILVALDGSDCSARALEHAIDLARRCDTPLRLLNVVDTLPMGVEAASAETWQVIVQSLRERSQAVLDEARARALAGGVAAEAVRVEFPLGRVADTIVDEAKAHGCDLIVMGSHGRRGFSHLMLGSDAERVLRVSTLPVLVVRQPEG